MFQRNSDLDPTRARFRFDVTIPIRSRAELLRLIVYGLEDVRAAAVHLEVVVVVLPERLAVRYREEGDTHLKQYNIDIV